MLKLFHFFLRHADSYINAVFSPLAQGIIISLYSHMIIVFTPVVCVFQTDDAKVADPYNSHPTYPAAITSRFCCPFISNHITIQGIQAVIMSFGCWRVFQNKRFVIRRVSTVDKNQQKLFSPMEGMKLNYYFFKNKYKHVSIILICDYSVLIFLMWRGKKRNPV